MKKTLLFLFAILMVFLCSSCNGYQKADIVETSPIFDVSIDAVSTPAQKPSATDSAIAVLLQPHIDKAIEDYFGERTQYALYDAKVDSVTQAGTNFVFQIVITIPTFHGPHNPPYGLETMTFTVKPGGIVILEKYEHHDNSM